MTLKELITRIQPLDEAAMEAARRVKQGDGVNDLLERIAGDATFGVTLEDLQSVLEPRRYVGRAPEQTREFLASEVAPVLEKYQDDLGYQAEINV